jgi:outer membrane lipoprotein-sorting protein
MATTYANCKTYQDTGVVEFVYDRGTRTESRPFKTAFVRPDRFRFEYSVRGKAKSRHIVWARADDVRTWWDVTQRVDTPPSLGLAVAGASGVSGGSAHTIPALLLPTEVGGRHLTDVTEANQIADATLDNVQCHRVVAKFGGSPITIWIDPKNYTVRRIDWQDARVQVTTTYHPVLDEEIGDTQLEFDAPTDR